MSQTYQTHKDGPRGRAITLERKAIRAHKYYMPGPLSQSVL